MTVWHQAAVMAAWSRARRLCWARSLARSWLGLTFTGGRSPSTRWIPRPGEVWRGQIESTPAAVEPWVAGFADRVIHVAVEACTGWLFVCRALERCGAISHLAEPVETSALRGRKRRAKTVLTRNGCASC